MPVNTPRKPIMLEVCIDSVASALAAQDGGAHRVELCDNLNEGGTTPSAGMIHLVHKTLLIPIHVMIRPRGGDFVYSDHEYEVMKHDIETAKGMGCAGVVFGLLMPDGGIDTERTAELTDLSHPMKTTFHRAFDMASNTEKSLACLIDTGVDYLLTSGQKPTALEGMITIKALVEQAQGRIEIMAGGGISSGNVATVVQNTGVATVHASASGTCESSMIYRKPDMTMSGGFHPSEYIRRQTKAEHVRAILKSAAPV